jgi:hypothetical protein
MALRTWITINVGVRLRGTGNSSEPRGYVDGLISPDDIRVFARLDPDGHIAGPFYRNEFKILGTTEDELRKKDEEVMQGQALDELREQREERYGSEDDYDQKTEM